MIYLGFSCTSNMVVFSELNAYYLKFQNFKNVRTFFDRTHKPSRVTHSFRSLGRFKSKISRARFDAKHHVK